MGCSVTRANFKFALEADHLVQWLSSRQSQWKQLCYGYWAPCPLIWSHPQMKDQGNVRKFHQTDRESCGHTAASWSTNTFCVPTGRLNWHTCQSLQYFLSMELFRTIKQLLKPMLNLIWSTICKSEMQKTHFSEVLFAIVFRILFWFFGASFLCLLFQFTHSFFFKMSGSISDRPIYDLKTEWLKWRT